MPIHVSKMRDRLTAELEQTLAELRAHMASWEYAFANAGGCHGGAEHPSHWVTRERTERLTARCRDLRARLAEFDR
jgi:BMFP domain-containing protein YqiC